MLDGLPFELLMNARNELLISNYSIAYNYSSRGIKNNIRPQAIKLLAVAPGFCENKSNAETYSVDKSASRSVDLNGLKLEPLSNTLTEVEEIGKLFAEHNLQYTIMSSDLATKTNFIDEISEHSIAHIATHGISKSTNESGLFFTRNFSKDNGFLSLYEIFRLHINVDLVVLSACKTGVGEVEEGEGVMALPRGFIYAGVPNVMASLWKVQDERTKDLMLAFYKYLLEDKETYAVALRKAKLECMDKGFLPVDWAGFVLIGE